MDPVLRDRWKRLFWDAYLLAVFTVVDRVQRRSKP